jgi:hypothetical protein
VVLSQSGIQSGGAANDPLVPVNGLTKAKTHSPISSGSSGNELQARLGLGVWHPMSLQWRERMSTLVILTSTRSAQETLTEAWQSLCEIAFDQEFGDRDHACEV